jgi:hypothetical protein
VSAEIAISNFPTQLEPLIVAGTRGMRSLRERGVQASGRKGQVASEFADRRSHRCEFYIIQTREF